MDTKTQREDEEEEALTVAVRIQITDTETTFEVEERSPKEPGSPRETDGENLSKSGQ